MLTRNFKRQEVTDLPLPSEVWTPIYQFAAAVLQPWRDTVGLLRVTSWFRSFADNERVGGADNSQHLTGEAVDVAPMHMPSVEAFGILYGMALGGVPVDQAIYYTTTGHIHVSHTITKRPRCQFLVKLADGTFMPWRKWREGQDVD